MTEELLITFELQFDDELSMGEESHECIFFLLNLIIL